MSRRLAIHTLLAVGVSVATIGCKTIKSTLGLSKDPKEQSAQTNPNLPPGNSGTQFPPPGIQKPVTAPPKPVAVAGVTGGQGKVMVVDKVLGFIVADFPFQMPPAEQRYYVYRGNQQVGEVVTTGEIDGTFMVADINKGDIREGDLIRPE
jgi:hypothetical protein